MHGDQEQAENQGPAKNDADPDALGLKGSTTQVVRVFAPQLGRGERTMLQGTVDEIVEKLVEKLTPYL